MPGDGAGHQPQRCHHHWRHAAGPVAQGSHGLFVLFWPFPHSSAPGYSLYKERELLQVADLPMFAVGLFFLCECLAVCALVAAPYQHAQFCALCLVPHSLCLLVLVTA